MVPWSEYLDHIEVTIQVAEREGLHRGKNVARLSQEKLKVWAQVLNACGVATNQIYQTMCRGGGAGTTFPGDPPSCPSLPLQHPGGPTRTPWRGQEPPCKIYAITFAYRVLPAAGSPSDPKRVTSSRQPPHQTNCTLCLRQ